MNIRIEVGDMLKEDIAAERQKISQNIAETISAVGVDGMPLVNREVLLRKYYKMYGYTPEEVEEIMNVPLPPPPPPQPQQPQQGTGAEIPPELLKMAQQAGGGQIVANVRGEQPQQETIPPEMLGGL